MPSDVPAELPPRPADDALVTVLRAPAGFGKTAAVARWTRRWRESGVPAAWCVIEEQDDDPAVLSGRIVAAVRAAVGGGGGRAPDLVAALADLVSGRPAPVRLVLDNLERLRAAGTLRVVERLLTWLPSGLRLVICTRVERPIGLHRLRVSGVLREIRSADLALTRDRTAQVVAAHGVHLDDVRLDALWRGTAGWPAVVRLAAAALAADPALALEDIPGTHPAAAHFLDGEVLGGLPAEQRYLLECTSVPDWFDAELAVAVTGNPDAPDLLAELARTDLLLVSHGGTRYRQHPFVRAHLLHRLRLRQPAGSRRLHRVTARWSAGNDDLGAAARHAHHGGDAALAARLVATHGPELLLRGEIGPVLDLLRTVRARALEEPEVGLVRVLADLCTGEWEQARGHLAGIAEAVEASTVARVHALDTVVRTHWSQVDRRAVPELNRLTARLSAVAGSAIPVLAWANRGVTLYWLGRHEAEHDLRLALRIAERQHYHVVVVQCRCFLAGVAYLRGDMPETRRLAMDALEAATRLGSTRGRGAAYCLAGWAAHQELDDTAAARWAARARAAIPAGDHPVLEFWVRSLEEVLAVTAGADAPAALARLRAHPGRLDGGNAPPPVLVAHEALLVQWLALRAGRPDRAAEIQQAAVGVLGTAGESLLLRARAHLHHDRVRAAHRLVERIADDDTRSYFVTTRIEARLLAATLAHRAGEEEAAATQLRAAAELAAPGRVLRPFREAGEDIRRLVLSQVDRSGWLDPFLQELLARGPAPDDLVALTGREAQLLRALPSPATVAEIAARFALSPNTVKTHLRSIYRKLGVTSRRAAVATGRRRGLI